MAYSESEFDLTLESKRNNRVVNVFVSRYLRREKWTFRTNKMEFPKYWVEVGKFKE